MAWYSYFLLCIPEAFAMIILTLVLLGIPIKKYLKSIIIFSLSYGAVAFILNIFLTNSLKPILTIIMFSLLVAYTFKFRISQGLIISLISFVGLTFFEITLTLVIIKVFSLSYEVLLINPLLRIQVSACATTMPMLLTAFILQKFNIKIKMPILPN